MGTNIESLNSKENIIYKAYIKLKEKYNCITGVKVLLNKISPASSIFPSKNIWIIVGISVFTGHPSLQNGFLHFKHRWASNKISLIVSPHLYYYINIICKMKAFLLINYFSNFFYVLYFNYE